MQGRGTFIVVARILDSKEQIFKPYKYHNLFYPSQEQQQHSFFKTAITTLFVIKKQICQKVLFLL